MADFQGEEQDFQHGEETSRMFSVCVTSFLALSDNHEVGLCSESPQTRWMGGEIEGRSRRLRDSVSYATAIPHVRRLRDLIPRSLPNHEVGLCSESPQTRWMTPLQVNGRCGRVLQ
jgi:hypothetical protein